MTDLRIESIEPRLFEPGEVATLALALLARAQMMGFLPPRDDAEWAPVREVVGDELLGRLLRVSVSSLRRYAGGERTTPDAVAWRLHAVARVVAALIGSYNGYGVRRWFERRRVTLDGAAPAEVFVQVESEDDERLQRVLGLADELTG